MTLLFELITALFITMLLVPPLIKSAGSLGFLDEPNERKVHCNMIPRIGGVAMVLGFIISILLWSDGIGTVLQSYLIGGSILFIFSVWDDRSDLDYKLKFLVQLLAVLPPVLYGDIKIQHFPFLELGTILPDHISIPLSIFVFLGITNAINLSDGLDGLAGGTSLLMFGIIAALAYIAGAFVIVSVAIAIMGSILGFLRYNTYPAQIFMGDSGSQFLGFSAGILSIWVTQKSNTALSPVLPLLILGLPVLDTVIVVVQRIYEKRSPFSADKNHIHHRLLKLGFGHHEAVFLIYITQCVLIVSAYFFRYESDTWICSLYLLFSLSVLTFFKQAEKNRWQAHGKHDATNDVFTRFLEWLRNRQHLRKGSFYVLSILFPTYLLLALLAEDNTTKDVVFMTIILLVFMLLINTLNKNFDWLNWIEKICIYTSMTIFVYLVESTVDMPAILQHLLNSVLALIAITVALHIRYSTEKNLTVTPLDFLVLFIVVSLSFLSTDLLKNADIAVGLTKVVVLFYGVELLLNNLGEQSRFGKYFLYGCLAIVAAQGLMTI